MARGRRFSGGVARSCAYCEAVGRPAEGYVRVHIELLDTRLLASVTPAGGEFALSLTVSDTQQTPAVAVDASGNSIAVWQSNHQDAEGWGIYGRKLDPAGNPVRGEFLVNQTQTHDQTDPSIAVDAAGDFVVSWTSTQAGHPDIYARVFNSAATPITNEILVNASTTGNQQDSAVGMDASGNFVVTFEASGARDLDVGVYYRYFSASGNPNGKEALVNTTTTGVQNNPSIAMAPDGTFVVAWTDKSTTKTKIRAQRFNSGSANPAGGEITVGAANPNNQDNASVGIDGAGNFVVTWAEQLPDPNKQDVLRDGTTPRERRWTRPRPRSTRLLTSRRPSRSSRNSRTAAISSPGRVRVRTATTRASSGGLTPPTGRPTAASSR